MKYNTLLFPRKANQTNFSLFLLSMRLLFGSLLMTHGYAKLMGFAAMSASFPDPLGIGSRYSLMLAIFGELFCSVAFVAHGGSITGGELAFVYLVVFILMYMVGPGKYSVDHWMTNSGKRRR